MTERTIIQMENQVTQSIDAVKALLTWRGHAVDPMPATELSSSMKAKGVV